VPNQSDTARELLGLVADPTPGAMLLAADNTVAGWVPLDDAVEDDRAYVVTPKPEMLCVDLDLEGCDADEVNHRNQSFAHLRSVLDVAGVGYIVVASGRPGHRHLVAHVGRLPGHVRSALAGMLRDGGMDLRDRGIRPPLSPHRLGLPVCLVTPQRPAAAVRRLARPAPPGTALTAALGVRPRLSTRMRKLLREGHDACGYASPSHGRMALAVAATAAGLERGWLVSVLRDPANRLGDTFRAKPSSWQDREIDRLTRKAAQYIATGSATDAVRTADGRRSCEELTATIRQQPWPGAGGVSELAVLEALLTIGHKHGSTVVHASKRTIALASGLHHQTVTRALRRLAAKGWLRLDEPATPTTSAAWQVAVPDGIDVATERQVPTAGTDDDMDLSVDAGRRDAVGKSALRVWRTLDVTSGCTTNDLAARLGTSSSAVRRHLRNLTHHGMVMAVDDGWCRGTVPPDVVAHRCGTAGARNRQRHTYLQYWADRRHHLAAATARWRHSLHNPRRHTGAPTPPMRPTPRPQLV
jgi:DNA-binding transcriptional ArsR family regulator